MTHYFKNLLIQIGNQLYRSLFKINTFGIIYFREARNLPNEWLITSVITTVDALAYNIEVKVNELFTEPIFLYSIILGLPGTKKSFCIKMIKSELTNLIKDYNDAITLNQC